MFRKKFQFNRKPFKPRTRVNHWIKISPIRLIDETGKNLGEVATSQALKMAQEKGLDLIEIAPNAKPPVCRIMSYGKFQYQQSKKEKDQRSNQTKIEMKGIRLSPRISQHDLNFKAKQAEKFLSKDYKVKIEMILKGREKALFDAAKEKLDKFMGLIETEVEFDQQITRQPRGFMTVIKKKK